VPSLRLEDDQVMENTPYSDDLLRNADCVVIITDHSTFDYPAIVKHSTLVVDTRNATHPVPGGARVVTL
jgi:UDP-N-acetyl-D-glucosamine dehydrogenase